MVLILFGLELLSISISFGVIEFGDSNNGYCGGYVWLIIGGLVLILSPIAGKTWAIYEVFAYAEKLQEFEWGSRRLFIVFVLIPFLSFIIYLSIWTVSDDGMSGSSLRYNDINDHLIEYCDYNFDYIYTPCIICILGLVLLSFLSFRSRHVPANWRESKYLALTVFSFVLIMSLFVPLVFIQSITDLSTLWLLRSLCGAILIQCVLALLFYTKFYIVFGGIIDHEGNMIDHNDALSEMEASSRMRSKLSTYKDDTMVYSSDENDHIKKGLNIDLVAAESDGAHRDDEDAPVSPFYGSQNYLLRRRDSEGNNITTGGDDEMPQLEMAVISNPIETNEHDIISDITGRKQVDKEEAKLPNGNPNMENYESTAL